MVTYIMKRKTILFPSGDKWFLRAVVYTLPASTTIGAAAENLHISKYMICYLKSPRVKATVIDSFLYKWKNERIIYKSKQEKKQAKSNA